jgi:hypothetical protein
MPGSALRRRCPAVAPARRVHTAPARRIRWAAMAAAQRARRRGRREWAAGQDTAAGSEHRAVLANRQVPMRPAAANSAPRAAAASRVAVAASRRGAVAATRRVEAVASRRAAVAASQPGAVAATRPVEAAASRGAVAASQAVQLTATRAREAGPVPVAAAIPAAGARRCHSQAPCPARTASHQGERSTRRPAATTVRQPARSPAARSGRRAVGRSPGARPVQTPTPPAEEAA